MESGGGGGHETTVSNNLSVPTIMGRTLLLGWQRTPKKTETTPDEPPS